MTHLSTYLPQRIELLAVRKEEYATEIVTMDSGRELRNNRHANPIRSYDVAMPIMREDDTDLAALRALYAEAQGSLNSFNFHDFTDSSDATVVAVRFDSPLQITAIAPDLFHVDSFTLKEELGEDS